MANRCTFRHLYILVACAVVVCGAQAADWRTPSDREWHDMVVGNTSSHTGGNWSVYYAPDGRKVIKTRSETRLRKWWMTADGRWCETLYRDGAEVCSGNTNLQVRGNMVRKPTSYGGTDWSAEVVAGNPLGL